MKKTALLIGAAALTGYGAYAASDALFKALVTRKFEVPKAVSKFIMQKDEKSHSDSVESPHKTNLKWLESYGYELHSIINDRGCKLQGYLMRPEKPSDVYVFASHGYRSNGKDEWCYFARFYLEQMGYNLFFVDHQAAGESEGEYIGFASHESKDCLKWLGYMNETFGSEIKIILHGISMGSTTVLLMAGSEKLPDNVKYAVSDCGFTGAMDEFMYKIDTLKLPFKPIIPIVCAMNRKRAGYDFKADTNALESVKKALIPILFIHGDKDKFVPTEMVYRFYDACNSEKELFVVPNADHAKSYHLDKQGYEDRIKRFSERYL